MTVLPEERCSNTYNGSTPDGGKQWGYNTVYRSENDVLRYMRVLFACPKQPRITRSTVLGQNFLKQVGLAVTKLLILGAWYS